MKHVIASITTAGCLLLAAAGMVFAQATPTTGQPGASSGNTCGLPPDNNSPVTPGSAAMARGSVFNPNGTAGGVYAGNPGTKSLQHSNSTAAVSQYDVACFQLSNPPPTLP